MSTYAVFGMTKPRAIDMAKKAVDNKLGKSGNKVSESEWNELVAEKANDIMSSNKVVMLSDKFDAPQFAGEFRRLAKRIESRDLVVKAHCKADGYTPTGKPKMQWVPTTVPRGHEQ